MILALLKLISSQGEVLFNNKKIHNLQNDEMQKIKREDAKIKAQFDVPTEEELTGQPPKK